MEAAPGMAAAAAEAEATAVAVAGVDAGVALAAALGVAEAALGVDAGAGAASEVAAALGVAEPAGVDMVAPAMVAAGLRSTLPFLPAWAHLHPSTALTGALQHSSCSDLISWTMPREFQKLGCDPNPDSHCHPHRIVAGTERHWPALLTAMSLCYFPSHLSRYPCCDMHGTVSKRCGSFWRDVRW